MRRKTTKNKVIRTEDPRETSALIPAEGGRLEDILPPLSDNLIELTNTTVRFGPLVLTFDEAFLRNGQLVIFVTPANLDGFTTQVTGTPLTAAINFVAGPGIPPAIGKGSVQLATGANGNGTTELRNSLYDLLPLASLNTLRYSTYVTTPGGKAPYLLLDIDTTGTGVTADEHLFFEPFFQATPLTLNTWQTWDTLGTGLWYPAGGGLTTLAAYVGLHPAARIINTAGAGGVHIAAGPVAGIATPGGWSNFIGNVNPLIVGDSATDIIYDFDPSAGLGTCR